MVQMWRDYYTQGGIPLQTGERTISYPNAAMIKQEAEEAAARAAAEAEAKLNEIKEAVEDAVTEEEQPAYITEKIEPMFSWMTVNPRHEDDVMTEAIMQVLVGMWIMIGMRIFYTVVLFKFWKEAQWIMQTQGNKDSHPCRQNA